MGNKNSHATKKKLSKKNPYNHHHNSTHTKRDANLVRSKSKDLPEEDYEPLQSLTKLSREEIRNCYRIFMTDYPNGKLDKTDFKIFYTKLRPEPNENLEKLCEFVFSAFDTDHSGFLDFNEFLIGFCLTSRGNLKDKLYYAFNLYDIDNSQNLSIDEIREVIKGMLKLLGVNEINHDEIANNCILKLDKNKDGLISRDEFVDGLIEDEALRRLMSPFI